jgi:hypothetical protein
MRMVTKRKEGREKKYNVEPHKDELEDEAKRKLKASYTSTLRSHTLVA